LCEAAPSDSPLWWHCQSRATRRCFCRTRELLAVLRLDFVRSYGACTRSQRARAVTLLGQARALLTAAPSDARWLRRRWHCRIKHDRGVCRTRELFALPRLVFVLPCGVCTRSRCVGAAALLSGVLAVCTAATGFAGVTALAIAELSTTEAFAARMSCLLCRGLFSCCPAVFVCDRDAWVQRRFSVGRMMCAQLPLDSQV